MRKKVLLCISLWIAAAFSLTACNENDDLSASGSISGTSDINSDQSGDPAPEISDPAQSGYVQDEAVLAQVEVENYDPAEYNILYATEGLECKALFRVREPDDGNTILYGIELTETGFVSRLSHYPSTTDVSYTHYLWFDRDGNELDHVGFDLNDPKGVIPDRDYPDNGFFTAESVLEGIRKALYFQNGTLQKAVQLPKCRRSDFSPDKSQFLCIDEERKNLILYDFETDTVATVLPVEKFGYDDAWVLEFVRVVTPELATVTLLEYDADNAGEYNGKENLRTYLLELPTLNILQQLPDGAELTALGDGNFLMTKQADKIRRVSRAKLEDGKLVEMETDFVINETSQFFDRSNIILSPDKKVALLRDWISGWYGRAMRCRVVSTDDMRLIWECHVSDEIGGLIPGGLMPAAISDDAVLYLFSRSELQNNANYPLYRLAMK